MFRPRIIPCLLIRNGGLVKTVKFNQETYIGDPLNAVRLFNDLEADELVFLDIDATKEGRTISAELVEKIGSEAYMPFSAGGGIRSLEAAEKIITAGAEKVVINTAAEECPELIPVIAEKFGQQSVIVSIDAKKNLFGQYCVAIRNGRKMINKTPWDFAAEAEKNGAGEIIINSVDLDGMMTGYDINLIKKVAQNISVPLIALGGVGNFTHLKDAIANGHANAVAAGSLFVFYGPNKAVLINYPSEKERQEEIFI